MDEPRVNACVVKEAYYGVVTHRVDVTVEHEKSLALYLMQLNDGKLGQWMLHGHAEHEGIRLHRHCI